jgi:hypothetical protein
MNFNSQLLGLQLFTQGGLVPEPNKEDSVKAEMGTPLCIDAARL